MFSVGHKWGCIKSSSLVSCWQRICAMWQCNSCANALLCSQMCWSWRCSCSAELNRFRGRAVRTALLSCLCHRGLLYSSDYISRERLRQLNFMHKAHLPVAHGTSLWVWNPVCTSEEMKVTYWHYQTWFTFQKITQILNKRLSLYGFACIKTQILQL